MESIGNPWLYPAFFAIVAVMLFIDFLGFKQKEGQEVKVRTAAYLEYCLGYSRNLIWWWFVALSSADRCCHRKYQNHGIFCRLFTRKIPRN